MIKVPVEAQTLRAGDRLDPQGLVIGVQVGYAKTKITFKDGERQYPNAQVVYILVVEAPSLLP